MKNNQIWGNSIIGRIFCYIYKIRLHVFEYINSKVVETVWLSGPIEAELDTIVEAPTGYLYLDNKHYDALD